MDRSTNVKVGLFRIDINGLRAVAVLLVILFHYNVPYLDGGFIGVDIFFVISGFLMTQIVCSRLHRNEFSFLAFYKARLVRIVPALLAVIAALLAVGWFLIDPVVYGRIGTESVYAALFVSNIHFFLTNGYFAVQSSQIWLLHTWSLSIEWQCYLVYPVYLWALWKLRIPLVAGVAVALLLSLGLSAWGLWTESARFTSFLFYSLPSRIWEILAGGLVYLVAGRAAPRFGRIFEWTGLALIVAAVALFDRDTVWPGLAALVPVLGTALLLAADRGTGTVFRFVPLQRIGSWSYSLYLWHWPIVVGLRYFELTSPLSMTAGFVLTLTAGYLSHRFIETPGRNIFHMSGTWRTWAIGASTYASILLASYAVFASSGFLSRLPEQSQAYFVDEAQPDGMFDSARCDGAWNGEPKICEAGAPGGERILVLGDSHGEMWSAALSKTAERLGKHLSFMTSAGCLPIAGLSKIGRPDCGRYAKRAYELARTGRYAKIIIIGFWSNYFDTTSPVPSTCLPEAGACIPVRDPDQVAAAFDLLQAQVETLSRTSRVTVFLNPPSLTYNLPLALSKAAFEGEATGGLVERSVADMRAASHYADRRISAMAGPGVSIFDTVPVVCPHPICRFADPSGRIILMDNNHMRADFLTTLDIAPVFQDRMTSSLAPL